MDFYNKNMRGTDMSNKPLTFDGVIELVKETMDSIDSIKLYYELKKKKIKFIRDIPAPRGVVPLALSRLKASFHPEGV